MPVAKLKPMLPQPAAPERAPRITGEVAGAAEAPSPARQLQQQLQLRTATLAAPEVEKWPLRHRAGLILGSSLALWLAILMAASQAVKMIA